MCLIPFVDENQITVSYKLGENLFDELYKKECIKMKSMKEKLICKREIYIDFTNGMGLVNFTNLLKDALLHTFIL